MSSSASPLLGSRRHSLTSRWWDLPAALLLLAALATAASRLVATEWVDRLNMVQVVAVLGGLAGLGLGQSCFSPRLASAFGLAYGLFAVPWRLVAAVGRIPEDVLWSDRLIGLAARLVNAVSHLAQQEPVQDPVLFLCGMASLFWALGVHAGYSLTRYARSWRVVLPAGLTLLIVHNSDPYVESRSWYLGVYLLFSLLLLGRLTYVRQRSHWRQTGAHVPSLIALDFAPMILLAAALLVLVAWTVPALADALPPVREAWEAAIRPWWAAWHDRLDDVFASLRRPAVLAVGNYYGNSLPLGRGTKLTDALVLTVQGPPRRAGMRHYWRARVYDHYAVGEWNTIAISATRSLKPSNLVLAFPELEGRQTLTFTFTSAVPMATLCAAPQPRWVSRPAQADLAENPDGTADLAALHATPALRGGESYQARSSLSSVTIAQLRAAGAEYPQWVTDRYLQVPSSVTARTLALARRVAAGQESAYDVADAVTAYLRGHIRYSETLSSLPSDQEALDWFLFDGREGYCNYYASAEVILLRSLGIPARLAVGFAQGERQPGTNTYLVRQRDAHAWPEVYFPGVGWVEFEPTTSQSPLRRPLDESEVRGSAEAGDSTARGHRERLEELLALEGTPLPEGSGAGAEDYRTNAADWAVFLGVGLILIVVGWRWLRGRGVRPLPVLLEAGLRRFDLKAPGALRRWARRAVLAPVERAYLELDYALARLGSSAEPTDTSAERAAALASLVPEAADSAQRLLREYQLAVYSLRPGNLQMAQQAARAIRSLSWRAKIRRLFARRHELGLLAPFVRTS